MPRKLSRPAVAYIRTLSTAAVGDKASELRQRSAVEAFAREAGFDIVGEYRDPAVSGVDPLVTRPGFCSLLDRIESNSCRTVLVEDASRIARDLVTQKLGVGALVNRGVRVLASNGDDLSNTDDPFRVAMRQIARVVAQLEKARLVCKPKGARDRKRATRVKVEGRKSIAELNPTAVDLAKRLRQDRMNGRLRTFRQIADELAAAGHLTRNGTSFGAAAIAHMVES